MISNLSNQNCTRLIQLNINDHICSWSISWRIEPFFLAIHGSKYRLHERHHEEFENVGNWDIENAKYLLAAVKRCDEENIEAEQEI